MNKIFTGAFAPPIPDDDADWDVVLRWMLAVMDDDDSSLQFVSGCLSQFYKFEGLSSRQAVGCSRVYERVRQDYEHMQLSCHDYALVVEAQKGTVDG